MNIASVISNNKCVSCGMCSSICPKAVIKMQYNKSMGFYVPVINSRECIDCGICINYCPTNVPGNKSLIGSYRHCYLAHSADESIRLDATSGGVINALVQYILKNKIVEAVLLVIHDDESPIESSAFIITSSNMNLLEKKPREFCSRYVSVPLMEKYKELSESYQKVAIVGTPCQINSLLCLKKNKINVLKIGITCSAGTSYIATEQYKKMNNATNAMMYYRGEGWPGCNSLVTGDYKIDNTHTGSLFERMFSSQIFKNSGCRYCEDHFVENADISFCDFWDKEEMKNEKKGNSCVIVRSEYGERVFNSMLQEKKIVITKTLEADSIIKTQYRVLKAKKGNLRHNWHYIAFFKVVNLIKKFKLYRYFRLKTYQKMASYYSSLCEHSKFI